MGRLGPWVGLDLPRCGSNGAPGQQLGFGLVTADTDREVRRTDAAASTLREKALDPTILERVKRDRRKPSPRTEQLPGRREGGVDLGQLVVDGDAQRLEGPPCGVPSRELGRDGHG